MNIIQRGASFLQWLKQMVNHSAWNWKHCPYCGSETTIKSGHYQRHTWFLSGRQTIAVQRHFCRNCRKTYSEASPLVAYRSWYAREVHRCAVDVWLHMGSSLRRTAEFLRSWMGQQERWLLWHPLDTPGMGTGPSYLSASTVHRWLDRAGQAAQESVAGQLEGIESSGALGTDGLWARLRGRGVRVVLLIRDSVTGLIWPPVIAKGEESAGPWRRLFERVRAAGLDLDKVRGITSDGAQGLAAYLRQGLQWVEQQRCVWHVWRQIGRELAHAASRAAQGLVGEAAALARQAIRKELTALVHGVIDATSYAEAEEALAVLRAHALGAKIAQILDEQLDSLLVHVIDYYRGLERVSPEWCWRDFRLRLSHGRNHGSDQRLERAALVWAIYHNFTPAQSRSERKRKYRHPGQSALQVAGVPPGPVSYLDALGV